jgi:uncharacterized membrane protein
VYHSIVAILAGLDGRRSAADDRRRLWQRAFVAASVVWAIAVPLAPLISSRPRPGVVSLAFVYSAYAIGRLICHQIAARSFHLWSVPLPVCARCTGIYAGAAITALAGVVWRTDTIHRVENDRAEAARTARLRSVLLLAVLPTVATVVYEWTTGDTPGNLLRALAGAPIGAAVAWIIREVN